MPSRNYKDYNERILGVSKDIWALKQSLSHIKLFQNGKMFSFQFIVYKNYHFSIYVLWNIFQRLGIITSFVKFYPKKCLFYILILKMRTKKTSKKIKFSNVYQNTYIISLFSHALFVFCNLLLLIIDAKNFTLVVFIYL